VELTEKDYLQSIWQNLYDQSMDDSVKEKLAAILTSLEALQLALLSLPAPIVNVPQPLVHVKEQAAFDLSQITKAMEEQTRLITLAVTELKNAAKETTNQPATRMIMGTGGPSTVGIRNLAGQGIDFPPVLAADGGMKVHVQNSDALVETRLDYAGRTDGQPVYFGQAAPGAATSADWTIEKVTYVNDFPTRKQVLTGAWDDRAILSW
jgi:hypothetical protein